MGKLKPESYTLNYKKNTDNKAGKLCCKPSSVLDNHLSSPTITDRFKRFVQGVREQAHLPF